jgi:ParB family chromosome partitioning protein
MSGLAHIFDDNNEDDRQHPLDTFVADRDRILDLPIDAVSPNPDQPRKHFDQAALDELTASVREKGILQPVIARKDPDGDGYILIAGERRWRAAKAAGVPKLRALIRDGADADEISLIENVQRENLNAIEEAEAYLRLKETRGYTDELLAKVVGKARSTVTETLSLNNLPDDIKTECRTSDNVSKSQLLQVIRAGSHEKVEATWQAFRSGEAPTVRALRKQTKPAKGRPKNYTFAYKPESGSFRLAVTFSKARVTSDEIKNALKEALKHVT